MKKCILVFDDDEQVIAILKTFLQQENYEVCSFNSPLEFHCVKKNFSSCQHGDECNAEAILTDFNMPGMNGWQLIEFLKKRNCQINKIALISGFIHDKAQFEAIFNDKSIKYFQKPFALTEIKKWLNEAD